MLIDAHEAIRRLGVKPDTLYAYVSRGLVRAVAAPGSKRKRYYAVDIERLKRNRRKGRRTGSPPPSYDSFAPVLDTATCLIEEGRLYYRGLDAVELAEHATLEQVAKILWGVDKLQPDTPHRSVMAVDSRIGTHAADSSVFERAKSTVLRLAAHDASAFDTSLPVVVRVGQDLIAALAASATGKLPRGEPVHAFLSQRWRAGSEGSDIIRRCLVLSADHELNPSTYVARCVASTGASPYAVVLAALCAFSGTKHGAHIALVEAMVSDLLSAGEVKTAVRKRWRNGERLRGFGHALYPTGDPRARALLDSMRRLLPKRATAPIFEIMAEETAASGRAPMIDFALAAAAVTLRLPPGSAQVLFLIGRTVGWIAHAIEQYATGTIIRPRARYVGRLPVRG